MGDPLLGSYLERRASGKRNGRLAISERPCICQVLRTCHRCLVADVRVLVAVAVAAVLSIGTTLGAEKISKGRRDTGLALLADDAREDDGQACGGDLVADDDLGLQRHVGLG